MAHIIEEKDMHPNFGRVPKTGGVPISVHIVTLLGIIAIFVIAGAVVLNSSYGHLWPATQTQRADLSGK
jgi:hypothetical protein